MSEYKIHYNNDIGPDDDGFWEWYEIHDSKGECVAKTDSREEAQRIVDALTYKAKLDSSAFSEELLHCLGEASMAWIPRPTGVFDSGACLRIATHLEVLHKNALRNRLLAADEMERALEAIMNYPEIKIEIGLLLYTEGKVALAAYRKSKGDK